MAIPLKWAWTDIFVQWRKPPKRKQVGALCYRTKKNGAKQILLITSRDRGRWIIPKGWPIKGLDAAGAAMQEAWEEAGVVGGKVANQPLGTFDYQKRLDAGGEATCETQVFPVEVGELADKFPESLERTRKWVSPSQAAKMVEEPELKEMLRDF